MSAAGHATVTGTTANMAIDQLTENDRARTASTRAGRVGSRAAKHNESGFRMAWEKVRRLTLVSSVAHSHRGRHQDLLNARGCAPILNVARGPDARRDEVRRC